MTWGRVLLNPFLLWVLSVACLICKSLYWFLIFGGNQIVRIYSRAGQITSSCCQQVLTRRSECQRIRKYAKHLTLIRPRKHWYLINCADNLASASRVVSLFTLSYGQNRLYVGRDQWCELWRQLLIFMHFSVPVMTPHFLPQPSMQSKSL